MISSIPSTWRTWASTNRKYANNMNEHFIKKLVSTLKCGNCGECYKVNSIKVRGYHNDIWFINASCSACQSQALVAATIKECKSTKAFTELNQAELTKFAKAGAISAEDILDMHSFLDGFDGDFVRLFIQK